MIIMSDYSEFLQTVSDMSSKLFGLETTVVNRDFIRIAGTHRFAESVGKYVMNHHVFRYVMEKDDTVIIRKPREEIACIDCLKKEDCHKYAAIYTPIKIFDLVVGGLAVVAYNEAQMKIITENQVFFRFIHIFSELLSRKLESEHSARASQELLNQSIAILNSVHDGVLLLDHTGVIKQLNQSAKKHFNFSDNLIGQSIRPNLTSAMFDEVFRRRIMFVDKEASLTINEIRQRVYLTASSINPNDPVSDILLTFKNTSDANSLAKKINFNSSKAIHFEEIIGSSDEIKQVISLARTVAIGNSNVLIRGESGTGKELFARSIHQGSLSSDGPFVAVNCSAIPEPLLESELFGYADGAFTGAKRGGKPGKCELASGGTLFLDEIGDMPLFMQAKLLRMIQERTVERVGDTRAIDLDVRIIAATHKNLEEMIANHEFREDLYYRLNVIPLNIPSLRQRSSDIEEISLYMLEKYNVRLGKKIDRISDDVLTLFNSYHWPGNIRELENILEYAINLEETDQIQLASLPPRFIKQHDQAEKVMKQPEYSDERIRMISLLDQHGWHTDGKKKAADELGCGIATLYRKIKKYNLQQRIS